MSRFFLIILFLQGFSPILAQSPHGAELKMDCSNCHNSSGWEVNYTDVKFDHGTAAFELEGTHAQTDCKACHSTLIFDEAPLECASCHSDIHNMSVGNDCIRCHTSESWLVDQIPELHEENGFPLIGTHGNLSCVECHKSETNLRFDRIGNECINCHNDDYLATQNPNHESAGYSTNCTDCHNSLGFSWNSSGISHDFFPLTLGHDIQDCSRCHTTGNYSDASPECIVCHSNDFQTTSNPNHQASGFSTDCATCHTTDPGWKPATFDHDDQFFPIYSGKHKGEWDACTDCHNNSNDYGVFTCLSCHRDPRTSDKHRGVSGYVYESNACLQCHPNGD